MNVRHKLTRKMATYISAIFCFLIIACFAQAQSRMPTQKDIDALEAEFKKFPTPNQQKELDEIMEKFNTNFDKVGNDLEAFGARIEKISASPGFPLSEKDIQDCISNHKRTRELYLNTVDELSKWGVKTSRLSCVRQSALQKGFFERGSSYFMATINGLPLGSVGERAASALWITLPFGLCGPGSLVPDIDARLKYSGEILGLYGVCNGARAEYVPGTE